LKDDQQERIDQKKKDLKFAMLLDEKNLETLTILKDSIAAINETVPQLRIGLDTLLQAMQSRNKRLLSKKVIKRSRQPTLDELCDFFTISISPYMRDNQKLNELNAYIAIRKIVDATEQSSSRLCTITRGVCDMFIESEAGMKVNISPSNKKDLLQNLKLLELNMPRPGQSGVCTIDEAEVSEQIIALLEETKASLGVQLKDTVRKYFSSQDYITASRTRLGKAWRCLVISKTMYVATFHLLEKIQKLRELASTLEDKSKNGKKLDEIKEAFKIAVPNQELRKSLEEQSTQLVTLFRHVGAITIRAGTSMKENFAAHQHKAKILEQQVTKKKDSGNELGSLTVVSPPNRRGSMEANPAMAYETANK
jgi:hypothetical protein